MRGVIKGVLAEELKNSLKMQKDYERSLRALPQGCLAKREVRGRVYYYLVRREGKKVVYRYKGIILPEEIKKYQDAKEKRAQYRGLLSRVKKQVRYLKGALRGKEQYDLFLKILRRFHNERLLDDVILIGSWTTVFYKAYFKEFKRLKKYALVTRDIDFLVDHPNRIKGKIDIPLLLDDLGFVVSFVGSKGYIHLVHPDLIVEFLTPERGRGVNGSVSLKNWSMNATALRFLDFLVKDKITVTFKGISIILPHPARFAIHKLVVAQRRTNKDKARKDNMAAIDILNDLIDAGEENLIRSIYKEFSLPWQKKIIAALKKLDAKVIYFVLENNGHNL